MWMSSVTSLCTSHSVLMTDVRNSYFIRGAERFSSINLISNMEIEFKELIFTMNFVVKDLLYSKTSLIWIVYSLDCHINMIINIQLVNYSLLFKTNVLFIMIWILCFVLNRNIFINFSFHYTAGLFVPQYHQSQYIFLDWFEFFINMYNYFL
jgi:hypothetical protein